MVRENLKKERTKRNLKQSEVASIIGISVRQYNAIEAGTSDSSLKIWHALKELFEKPIDYLVELL